jgi:hypothetical protein
MLKNLTAAQCGSQAQAGTEVDLYYTCSCELAGWPATKADNGGTADGDTKILDEPFDFTGAATGTGYWRKATIVIDTGSIDDALEGEVGGQGFKSSIPFRIKGTDAEQLEFADNLVAYSGCLVAMLRDRKSNLRVLGTKSIPASVESVAGTTGKKNGETTGFDYVLTASTGKTAPIYDDATHGINVTPVV